MSRRRAGRRSVRCKVCGEKWHPRKGKVYEFYDRHIELHGLPRPNPENFDSIDEYMVAVREFRERYFSEGDDPDE